MHSEYTNDDQLVVSLTDTATKLVGTDAVSPSLPRRWKGIEPRHALRHKRSGVESPQGLCPDGRFLPAVDRRTQTDGHLPGPVPGWEWEPTSSHKIVAWPQTCISGGFDEFGFYIFPFSCMQ